LKRRGIDPGVRRVDALLAETRLQPLAYDSLPAVEEDVPCRQIVPAGSGATDRLVVLDEQGTPRGTVSVAAVREAAAAETDPPARLGQLEVRADPVLPAGASLARALALLGESPGPMVLVADPETPQRYWAVQRDAVMRAYHTTLDRVYAEERGDFRGQPAAD
jgi:hypothetical protein